MFSIKPIHILIGAVIVLLAFWLFSYYRKSTFEGAGLVHTFVDDDYQTISFDTSDGSVTIETDDMDDIVIYKDGSIDGDDSNVANRSNGYENAFIYTSVDLELAIIYISPNESDSYVLILDSNNYDILGYIAYVDGDMFDMNDDADASSEGIISVKESTDTKRISDVKSKKSSYGVKVTDKVYDMGKNNEIDFGPDNVKTMDEQEWCILIEPDQEESLVVICSDNTHSPYYYIAFTLFMVNGELYVDPVLIHKRTDEDGYGEGDEGEGDEGEGDEGEGDEEKGGKGGKGDGKSGSVPQQIIDFWKKEMSTNDYIKKTQIVPMSCQTCPSQCGTANSPASNTNNNNNNNNSQRSGTPGGPISSEATESEATESEA